MSGWDLPSPESPITQSGSPALIQAPPAGVLMVAVDRGGGVEVLKQPLPPEPRSPDPMDRAVAALAEQELGEEPAVGRLLVLRGRDHVLH
jgi:hypothetical protein